MNEGITIGGEKHGLWVSWYDDGAIEEKIWYAMGVKWKHSAFHRNGNIKSETQYKHGLKDGFDRKYYENGRMLESGNYNEGKKDGEFKVFYESGEKKQWSLYDNGKIKSRTGWTKDGLQLEDLLD